MNSSIAIFNVLFGFIRIAVLVVGVILVALRTTGRRRTLGMVGLVLMGLGVLVSYASSMALPALMNSLDLSLGTILPIQGALLLVVDLVGLLAVIAALCARDAPAPIPPGPYNR